MLSGNSIIAGFLIGIGVLISTLTRDPIVGAFLFSFGLLTIIELGLPLYTGQIGFAKEKKWFDLLKILIFNLIGVLLCYLICFKPNLSYIIYDKSFSKFNKDYLRLFCDAFTCGTLIHFAVKCKQKIMTIMAIMIFILVGAEHCIADFPYLIVNFNWVNLYKYVIIIIGNSIGALFIEMCLSKVKKDDKVDLGNGFTITTTDNAEEMVIKANTWAESEIPCINQDSITEQTFKRR